ncbi:MAG: hypothetical protein M1829_003394 [Trizodia sp. TS-e1964]|nr:MAG: hypothetical protein M1829_003394 [Trizodia sp. TS-e1964]
MDNSSDRVALDTLAALESRVRRIEFALSGDCSTDQDQLRKIITDHDTRPVAARITDLEEGLKSLAEKSTVVADILKLYSKHPDYFQLIPPNEIPSALESAELLSIVLSSATDFPTTASRLTSIFDMPIPPPELSASLLAHQPRMNKIALLQEAQAKEVQQLRERSAAILERWYTMNVLSGGDCWAEWEERVTHAECAVRQQESIIERNADKI